VIILYIAASVIGGAVCGAAFFPHGFLAALLAAWAGATVASILLAVYVAAMRAGSEGPTGAAAGPHRDRMRQSAHPAAGVAPGVRAR
jgi:hypothetical protein